MLYIHCSIPQVSVTCPGESRADHVQGLNQAGWIRHEVEVEVEVEEACGIEY